MKLNEFMKISETELTKDAGDIATTIKRLAAFNNEDEKRFKINNAGEIDVHGDVDLNGYRYTMGYEIDVKFGNVNGTFSCANNGLQDLDFAPNKCKTFDANGNKLSSLKNVPLCYAMRMSDNDITSLDGMPKGVEVLSIDNNPITSLINVHEHLASMDGFCILIMSFENIVEGGVGLVLLKQMHRISHVRTYSGTGDSSAPKTMPEPFKIIEKYLGRPDDIFECQAELIEAGYEAYAQL